KEEISKIHLRITWAVIGLVVALSSYVIIKVIEGSISRNRIFPLLPKPAIAVSVSSPPTGLKCGSKVLPSIFSSDAPEREIWKDCLWYYVELVMIFLYRLAIALAVIFIAWAGLLYILQPEKTKEIHKRLIWGVIGAVIAILSFTIVRLIETFILTIT
ncbi:MAG: hypothetical protein NZ822_00855, partial [Patescibacteria group bacterium]|nr:hypothetical protein [Patescibacteria group bacterium]